MTRYVPCHEYFECAKKIDGWQKIVFWISFIISSILIILTIKFKELSALGTWVTFIVVPILFILNHLMKYYQNKGEDTRRRDYWDNSFGTRINDTNSTGYYTNNELDFGIIKAFYNTFENIVHSLRTSEKMIVKSTWFVGIMAVMLIIFCGIGLVQDSLGLSFLQLFFSKYILEDYMNLIFFKNELDKIKGKIQEILNEELDLGNFENNAIKILMDYECNLSKYGILLDTKIFNENNERVSREWENLKLRYPLKIRRSVENVCE
ncbi:MAG: hypothetical protein ACRDD2_12620 [Sarcina sp.]